MMDKKIYIVLVLLSLGFVPVSSAFEPTDDPKNFEKYNPDVFKFDFIRAYISSLRHIYLIEERSQEHMTLLEDTEKGIERTRLLLKKLNRDNLDWRIARNMVRDYQDPQNGLILKVVNVFTKFCDEQIEFNDQEKLLLGTIVTAYKKDMLSRVDQAGIMEKQADIAARRKESYKGLLKASLLAKSVLISGEANRYGEFETLGITYDQRQTLLKRLNFFNGENFKGDLREGQSFLEGSVAVLRDILSNYTMDTLENS